MEMNMERKIYSFYDHPEHREQLKPWADKWIANAMSTAAMTEEDRVICRDAVKRMYRAANLEPPPDERIVFVPSPFVLRFAAGFASWIWYQRKTGATASATDSATASATHSATNSATASATHSATASATDSATHSATDSATYSATDSATASATDRKDLSQWYIVNGDMVQCATDLGVGIPGLQCAQKAYNMWQGGNQWSAWDSYLSFFRHIAKLDIEYTAWDAWETLSLHSGPRVVHEKFCIISDRPEILTVDEQNRPHGETGPFCQWRDGSALYAWNGTNVPARWIEERSTLDPNEVISHSNVEMRAAGAAIVGWPKMLSVLKAKTIDDSGSSDVGQLIELNLPGLRKPGRFLKATCPRNGIIVEGVPHTDDFGLFIKTALHAQAWRVGLHPSEYMHPEVRT